LVSDAACPQQEGGVDCGVFSIEAAKAIVASPDKHAPVFTVTQDMMPRVWAELAIDLLLRTDVAQPRAAMLEQHGMYLDTRDARRVAEQRELADQIDAARYASLEQAEVDRRARTVIDDDLAAAIAASLDAAGFERPEAAAAQDGDSDSDDGVSRASYTSKTYDSDGPAGDSDDQAGAEPGAMHT
jgi:hypothetical protein